MAEHRVAFLRLFLQELQQELVEGGYNLAEEEIPLPQVGRKQEHF